MTAVAGTETARDVSDAFTTTSTLPRIVVADAVSRGRPQVKAVELQWLRGLAALFVLFYHAAFYQNEITGSGSSLSVFNGMFGIYGVAIFFAISGYLMANLIRRQDPARFMLHRIVRIYPLYFIVAAIVAIQQYLDGRPLASPLTWTLLPVGNTTYTLAVEWTLIFEIAYYTVLFVLALARLIRWLDLIAAIWLAVLLAVACTTIEPDGRALLPIQLMAVAGANIPFALGLLLPRLLRLGINPLLAMTGSAVLLFLGVRAPTYHLLQVATGASAALLVGAAASLARHRAGAPNLLDEWMSRAGDTSYALYLCHVPVVLLVYATLTVVTGPWAPWAMAAAVAMLVAAPVGLLDVRLYGRLRALVDGLSDRRANYLALLYLGLFVTVTAGVALSDLGQARRAIGSNWLVSAMAARANGGAAASSSIVGFIDDIAWIGPDHLQITGWAGDREHAELPVQIALLTRERVIATWTAQQVRSDVAAVLRIAAWNEHPTGFAVTVDTACAARQDYSVVAFNDQHQFAVLRTLWDGRPCP